MPELSSDLSSNISFLLTLIVGLGLYFVFFGGESTASKLEDDAGSKENTTSRVAKNTATDGDNEKNFILLLGVDDELFQACFGKDWAPYQLTCLPEDCRASEVRSMLGKPGLKSVVIQDSVEHPHWNLIKEYYLQGGFVVYFGIYGEFAAPATLGRELGFDWSFSAYTKHKYEVTPVGQAILGNAISRQQYTKSNLLRVPQQDCLLLPEILSPEQFLIEEEGITPQDEDWEEELEDRKKRQPQYRQSLEAQCPLALHTDTRSGGKLAYLGFVNGDGNIPELVRALLTGEKTRRGIITGL